MSRLDQLLAFLHEAPDDPFNIYAVALEYVKTDPEKALTFFEHLSEKHPDYIPTYYAYGKFLADSGQVQKATEMFGTGIRKAEEKGEAKTARELRNALSELEEW